MLLENFFIDTPASTRPTCPTNKNNVGQPKTLINKGISDTSDMSDTKNCLPDTWKGRPCCYLPHVPERLRGLLPPDLKGFGIPAQGLPHGLAQFSLAGWRLELDGDDVRMVKMHAQARMEQGCRDFLRANYELVLAALRQCEDTKEVVHQ